MISDGQETSRNRSRIKCPKERYHLTDCLESTLHDKNEKVSVNLCQSLSRATFQIPCHSCHLCHSVKGKNTYTQWLLTPAVTAPANEHVDESLDCPKGQPIVVTSA